MINFISFTYKFLPQSTHSYSELQLKDAWIVVRRYIIYFRQNSEAQICANPYTKKVRIFELGTNFTFQETIVTSGSIKKAQ